MTSDERKEEARGKRATNPLPNSSLSNHDAYASPPSQAEFAFEPHFSFGSFSRKALENGKFYKKCIENVKNAVSLLAIML